MWRLCSLSAHRRSAKLATRNYDAQRWESVCKHCGVSMVRVAHGKWRVMDERDRPPRLLFSWPNQSRGKSARPALTTAARAVEWPLNPRSG